jgi:very-short-patch-repair endonuclease
MTERLTYSRKNRDKTSLTSPLAGEGGSLRGERSETEEGPFVTPRNFAKRLRSTMTDTEVIVWANLRARKFENAKFRRQVPIGKYIADFVSFEARLIIELDGSQHSESEHDNLRDAWLAAQGFRVLRFWNSDIRDELDGAMRTISDALKETPQPARAACAPRSTFSRKGRSKDNSSESTL